MLTTLAIICGPILIVVILVIAVAEIKVAWGLDRLR